MSKQRNMFRASGLENLDKSYRSNVSPATKEALNEKKRGRKGNKEGKAKGTKDTSTLIMKRMMEETGELPHEFLLRVMRGEIEVSVPIQVDVKDENGKRTGEKVTEWVKQVPDLAMRVDAAKAAAPFYAPKLAAMNIDITQQNNVTLTSITLIKKDTQQVEGEVLPNVIDVQSKEDALVNQKFMDKLLIKKAVEHES